ncbi:MAG TPA: HAMP domain-containing sensor histidine kinase [Sandaracinaceae bacterium LLY-WYZ-13_1]|nr:HAMP domain-containing sensor histidine kinase [Sandaracinaceae bacterium LLY-WYZ-13_1]
MDASDSMLQAASGSASSRSKDRADGSGERHGAAPPMPPRMLSRLAHDIRSPLGLVSGALEELEADLASSLDPGHRRMFELAGRGLRRLERMASVLQTASELDGDGVELDRGEIDVGGAVRGTVERLERADPRRNVEVDVDARDGVTLSLDGPRFEEALRELVAQARRNARKRVRVAVEDDDEQLTIRVEDDGAGWSAERREHAFDRLYEPEDRGGTGLGLSVARDLIRLHDGEVVLEDSTLPPGRPGTVGGAFVITIPRRD